MRGIALLDTISAALIGNNSKKWEEQDIGLLNNTSLVATNKETFVQSISTAIVPLLVWE